VVAQAHRGSEQRWISIGELDNEMIAIVWHVTSKRDIHIPINEDVLDWFGQAGRGYQTRINNVLRSFMESRRRAPRYLAGAPLPHRLLGAARSPHPRALLRHGRLVKVFARLAR
jgi:BrnA antitoxin of type II toxin-antitoxin system